MKKFSIILGALALSMSLVSMGVAQSNTATTSSSAGATIITAIGITNLAELDFGNIVGTPAGGTVSLNPANNGASFSGVYSALASGHSSAAFGVSGEATYAYDITLPNSCLLTRGGGSETMTVDNFTSTSAGVLGSGGSETFAVGATLNVSPNQATGSYTGSFDVTVTYQ